MRHTRNRGLPWQASYVARRQEHQDGLVILRLSSYEQMIEVAESYRGGSPVAVLISSGDFNRRGADFISGLVAYNVGQLRKIATGWWLASPPGRALTASEAKALTAATGTSQGLDEP